MDTKTMDKKKPNHTYKEYMIGEYTQNLLSTYGARNKEERVFIGMVVNSGWKIVKEDSEKLKQQLNRNKN